MDALRRELQEKKTPLCIFPLHYRFMKDFARRGWIRPVGDLLPAKQIREYAPLALEMCSYQGTLYAIPEDIHNYALMVNRERLTEKGMRPPSTWSSLQEQARTFTEESGQPSIAISGMGGYTHQGFVLALLGSNGINPDAPPAKWMSRKRALAEAYRCAQALVRTGSLDIEDLPTDRNFATARDLFYRGELPFLTGYTNQIGDWEGDELDRFDAIRFPRGPGRKPLFLPLGGNGWCIPHNGIDTALGEEALRTITHPDTIRQAEAPGSTPFHAWMPIWSDREQLVRNPMYRKAASLLAASSVAYSANPLSPKFIHLWESFSASLVNGNDADEWVDGLSRIPESEGYQYAVANPTVRKAVRYIDERLRILKQTTEVAAHVDLSRQYLDKLFKEELGCSCWAYINQRRMQQARGMLGNSTHSVKEVAYGLGFSSPENFGRAFKQYWGRSPTEYRS